MSALTDALATRTVRPAIVGGVPINRPATFRTRTPVSALGRELLRRATSPETELERRAAWGDR